MTCTLHVAWDDRLADYNFGPGHPMAPIRLKLTMELARAFGLGHLDGVSVEVPAAATRAELELYHSPVYIDVVQLAGSGRMLGPGKQDLTERVLLMHGLGTEDDPLTNLELTIDAQRAAHAAIHWLAHEYAGGRWLLTGGSGYEHVHVVPRSWTHMLFEAAASRSTPVPRRQVCGGSTCRW